MLRGAYVSTQDLVRLRGRTEGLVLPNNPAVYRTGGFRSRILGRGMEYEKSRKYEPGDDVRMIDWRVTARTGSVHTKVFQEDRQKSVYLIVDLTSSMRFGTRVAFKSVVAVEAAALLAWSAHAQGDLIGMVGVTDGGVWRSELASSSGRLIRQLESLSNLSQSSPTARDLPQSLPEALSVIAGKVRTGDLTIVLSDCTDLTDVSLNALKFLSRRQSLIVCWIQDPIERQALPVGQYPITDGSQYLTLHVSSSERQKKLQRLLDQRNQAINDRLRDLDAVKVRLTCGDEVAKVLHRSFHRRVNRVVNGGSFRRSFRASASPRRAS